MSADKKDQIVEASHQARRTGTVYLTFVAYAILTILGLSDKQLVLNGIVRLPIVDSEVPLHSYFIVAPAVIMAMYVYFHLQLWMASSAISGDGLSPNDFSRQYYPWAVYYQDCPEDGAMSWIRKAFVGLYLWWSLPTVLTLFARAIVKKHNSGLTIYIGLLLMGSLCVLVFLRWRLREVFALRGFKHAGILCTLGAFAAFDVALLLLLLPWANQGKRFGPPKDNGGISANLGSFLVADLRRQVLVRKPDHDYKHIFWAELSDIRLEGADLTGAVLAHADLRRSRLQRAIAFSIDLTGADLSQANMAQAMMPNATLEGAMLSTANLAGAILSHANLRDSYPGQANFHGAMLTAADLENAEFYRSDLEGADLSEARLRRTNFRGSNLRRVVARDADFTDANLEGVFLDEAQLANARNLTFEQLSKAKSLFNTHLPPELLSQVRISRPDLLKPPNEDERPKIRFDRIFPGYDRGPDWSKLLGREE
jgi:uncharacterized protein YjbI with pentapeptide repeats